MATCPQCGNSSRTNPGSMMVEEVLVAQPETITESPTFQQVIVSARGLHRMTCEVCGWNINGHLQGDSFVVFPGDNPEWDAMRAKEKEEEG